MLCPPVWTQALRDVKTGAWTTVGGLRTRNVTYIRPISVPLPFSPKECNVLEVHTVGGCPRLGTGGLGWGQRAAGKCGVSAIRTGGSHRELWTPEKESEGAGTRPASGGQV
eukprot:356833-Chlamydomonas_euryale.AAC.1